MAKREDKKVAIMGSSIAGSALALLLGRAGMQVSVFEQKCKAEVGNKVCANVVTSSFLGMLKQIGINTNKIVNKRFNIATFYTQKNYVDLGIEDYEINRQKLLSQIIKKAQGSGVKFLFKTRFIDMQKTAKGFNILLEDSRTNKKIIEDFDFIVGADGAFSNVARKAGLWQNRHFMLAVQTKIPKKALKKIRVKEDRYYIFFIPKFGYYSYIFPSRNCLVVGTEAPLRIAKESFNKFADFLRIKPCKLEAALIPMPKKIAIKKQGIFLAGDAACQVKFTGGGIVPALESAFALRDFMLHKNTARLKQINKEILLHQLVTRVLLRMKAEDFDKLFEAAKKSNIKMVASRDELRRWAAKFVFKNPSLFKFLPKLF